MDALSAQERPFGNQPLGLREILNGMPEASPATNLIALFVSRMSAII